MARRPSHYRHASPSPVAAVAVMPVVAVKKDGLAMSAAKGAGALGLGILAMPVLIALVVVVAYFVVGVALAILQWAIPFVGQILFGFLTR